MARGLVAGVVGGGVVPRAEGEALLDAGRAAPEPRVFVMDVTPVRGDLAALGAAGLVPGEDQPPLPGGVEPLGAAVVQGFAVAAEDDRDDPGLTRDPSRL